jgi:hypothetical protein
MTRYTVDAVAMTRYLVDEIPDAPGEIFRRAEAGVDVLEAPPTTVGEAIYVGSQKGVIAGVDIERTPNALLRGLVRDGPVQISPTDEQDLAVFGSLIDHHTQFEVEAHDFSRGRNPTR